MPEQLPLFPKPTYRYAPPGYCDLDGGLCDGAATWGCPKTERPRTCGVPQGPGRPGKPRKDPREKSDGNSPQFPSHLPEVSRA